MADLKLTLAINPYDRLVPLINGEVKPDGITLEFVGTPGGHSYVFYQQMKFKRYDISEMSMSHFLHLRPAGWPYRMLPVFHNRNFAYTTMKIRKDSGIRQDHPEDLKGKRIGIGDYQKSSGLWVRGVLQMEFGIKPEDMAWYAQRGGRFSHTGALVEAGLPVPKGIELHCTERDPSLMLLKGEVDACDSYDYKVMETYDFVNNPVGDAVSSSAAGGTDTKSSDIVTLFSDPHKESIRFFKKTGVYPPHHTTIVRESILDEHPWVAISLMEAFEESKRIATERFRRMLPRSMMVFGQYYLKEIDKLFGPDPFPYGIKANAKAFDMAQTFSVQQGMTERKQPWEEIFPLEIVYRDERF